METVFERLDYQNNPTGRAETERHREIIQSRGAEGFRFAGYVPVRMGPSGKILAVDLVFQK